MGLPINIVIIKMLSEMIELKVKFFHLVTVGETGAHWDMGYSGTLHILEILRKRMPL